jgi:hypothetical protein
MGEWILSGERPGEIKKKDTSTWSVGGSGLISRDKQQVLNVEFTRCLVRSWCSLFPCNSTGQGLTMKAKFKGFIPEAARTIKGSG